jgi:hypothetical protein
MVPVSRRVRAYFAPVDRSTESGAVFDPGKHGAFPLDSPPSPWLDLGWIDNFQRFSLTSTETSAVRESRLGVGAISWCARYAHRIRFPRVGQVADGVGWGHGAHECAGA